MKKILSTALAILLSSTAANATVKINGSLTFNSTAPTTAHTAANKQAIFNFEVPDSAAAFTVGASSATTSAITNFVYLLDFVPVAELPTSVIFYNSGSLGMFDLVFGSQTLSLYGADIGSDGYVGPTGVYQPVQAGLNGGSAITIGGSVGVIAPVPEPATWALLLAGFGVVGMAMRRRQNVRVSFA